MRSLFQKSVVLMIAALTWASAASDLVDFGDSGIVVVVEPSKSGKEYGVAYIPWIPDEFYTFYPSLPAAPGVPWPVAWDREPPQPDPCQTALDQLSEIESEIVWRQETINWAQENGYLFDAYGGGDQVFAGSERFNEIIQFLEGEIEDLQEQRDEAASQAKRYCGPPTVG